jgi:apolipoprotein N-acyltransferase
MASVVDVRRAGAGVLAVTLAAVMVWFGTGLLPVWPLLWFAPLPVLMFAAGASWWGAAVVAGATWLVGSLNLWHYLHDVLRVPGALLVRVYAGETLVIVLAVLLFRALLQRGAIGCAVLAFPATRVTAEYLLSLISPHGTAWSLSYTQLELLPVLQLASVTGPWGVTFLVLVLPAALAAAWHVRDTRRRALGVAAAGVGAVIAVVVLGCARLALDARGPTVKVGLVASDPPASPAVADEGAPTVALLDGYASRAAALAAQGAQVIVLPEKLGVIVGPEAASMDARFQALADQSKAVIVVGVIHVAPPRSYNEARVYTPGGPVQRYEKRHLLPPFELRFEPGTALVQVARPEGPWGVAICKDMDFTPLAREYGRAGVGLMLVPAWDFTLDRRWHGHMAVMRGVESGFAMVRSAKQGYLTVSDNRGRILAEMTSDAAPFAMLLADVPVTHDDTLYLVLGDWFAWLVLGVLGVVLAQGVRIGVVARQAAAVPRPAP